MGKNYYYDEENIITDERAETIAKGLQEFSDVYLRFLIPNIKHTDKKKWLKKFYKMIKKVKDKKKRADVFNLKFTKIVMENCDDENRGLYD